MKAINIIMIIWMEYIWGIEYKCKSTTRDWDYNHVNRSDGDGVDDGDEDEDDDEDLQDPSPSPPRVVVMEI